MDKITVAEWAQRLIDDDFFKKVMDDLKNQVEGTSTTFTSFFTDKIREIGVFLPWLNLFAAAIDKAFGRFDGKRESVGSIKNPASPSNKLLPTPPTPAGQSTEYQKLIAASDSYLNKLREETEDALNVRFRLYRELLRTSDIVSLHVPLNASTKGLLGEAELALMKPSATLVNIARGGIVDELALIEALRLGRISAAGLDVFEGEPEVAPGLLALKNVVLTPHIASATMATRLKMAQLAADNLIAFFEQGRAITPLNEVSA